MRIQPSRDEMTSLTATWTGQRASDGRPVVPSTVLAALRNVTSEQAWTVLSEHGFQRSFVGGWRETRPGSILIGRAVTAQFLPHRPDYDAAVVAAGSRLGYLEPDRQNSWIISNLNKRDVMVVDVFGKVKEGTVVGDNLATAIVARTGNGAIIDGGIRDYQGIVELSANFFFRDTDPTPIRDVSLAGINIPIRIGGVTVLPGDVVLGTPSGVTFIPPHLAEKVAENSRMIRIQDEFGKLRLSQGTYTSAEIDVPVWADYITADFTKWLQENGQALE